MRGGAWPLVAFGTNMVIFGIGNHIWESSNIMSATYAFAALAAYGCAAVLFALGRREPLRRGAPPVDERPHAVPAASFGAMALGIGGAAVLFGFVFGEFLLIGGIMMCAGGVFLLVRELTAQRRALRTALEAE